MTLNELRYAVAVAQERSFRKAADKCFVTQPALSLAIQKLEEHLGIRLFERSKTEVSITPLGLRVIEQAQRVLEEAGKVREIAQLGRDPLVGKLALGVIYTVGPYLLPLLIPALHRLAPGMPLEIEENTTAQLSALLRAGSLDVIVIALPFGDAAIATQALYDEPFIVAVPQEHAWSARESIKARELAKERVLLLNSGHCFSNQVVEVCSQLARKTEDVQQGNSLETIRSMVASGLGITVLPVTACADRHQTRSIRSIPFADPVPSRRIALAWRRSFPREGAVRVLAAAVAQAKLPNVNPVKNREGTGPSPRSRDSR